MQVVCGGEFGTPGLNPENEKGETGHNAPNFTIWLAGRGVRVGHTHGKTDDTGSRAVEGKAHFRRATPAKTSIAIFSEFRPIVRRLQYGLSREPQRHHSAADDFNRSEGGCHGSGIASLAGARIWLK